MPFQRVRPWFGLGGMCVRPPYRRYRHQLISHQASAKHFYQLASTFVHKNTPLGCSLYMLHCRVASLFCVSLLLALHSLIPIELLRHHHTHPRANISSTKLSSTESGPPSESDIICTPLETRSLSADQRPRRSLRCARHSGRTPTLQLVMTHCLRSELLHYIKTGLTPEHLGA